MSNETHCDPAFGLRQRTPGEAKAIMEHFVSMYSSHDGLYPTPHEQDVLAAWTGLALEQVQHWFKSQRRHRSLPHDPDSVRSVERRARTRTEAWQHDWLEICFFMDQSPGAERRTTIAREVGETVAYVTRWFERRRDKAEKGREMLDFRG
ncbi:uncharacterized protein BXZ73DRAFT_79498 [Epithele typhae]|uniref:uncharacterized protein n=1 Tax=Epithele typhae TaxID=378194 RepID=UPI0020081E8D|nr:uncharacterized protein BXZ73DRAFT_79498 [Epithele typhae]KAH9923433.1 hypothetical protein BXZ73DRAFT_79498 [Epithele typhae]